MTFRPGPENIFIREMRAADLPEVEALDQAAFSTPWPKGSFKYELETSTYSICLVAADESAEAGGKIAGVVVVWMIIDEAHIATVAVKAGYRHKGVGRSLLAAALLQALKKGASRSLLEVRAGNLEALHLYYGFGYEIEGIRPGYYQDNDEDALLLTLKTLDETSLRNLLALKNV